MKKPLKFYIRQRYNPQVGTFFVPSGQLTYAEARHAETRCIYGANKMLSFITKKDYEAAIAVLRAEGNCVV